MAWGIFNKIKEGAVKVYNTAVPIAKKAVDVGKKVIDFAKPLLKDTKYGKYADVVEDVVKTGEDIVRKTEDYGGRLGLTTKQPKSALAARSPKTKSARQALSELEFDDSD